MNKRWRSRLIRKEESRNLRQAVFFGFLTVILALGLVFLGIPALIRMAIFLGNLRSSALPIETKDILPPPPPQLEPLPEATNSAQITIKGFSESGSIVEIFLSGILVKEVVANNDGTFSASGIELSSEKNIIVLKATDQTGNSSQESEKITVLYDTTPPELEIIEPINDSTYTEKEGKIVIKGKTEDEVTLTINERVVIVDSEGNFEYPFFLSEGENQILIVATDEAGNKTEEEIKITYAP